MEPRLILAAYMKRHLPKITYILHGTNPSSTFLQRETNFLTTSLLPQLGFNRHTPLTIRHCPNDRLGFELPNLYCEAGLIQIRQWLKHVRKGTEVGDQLIINLSWAQLRSVLASSIYIDTTSSLPHVPEGRTKWLRAFLNKIGGSLHYE